MVERNNIPKNFQLSDIGVLPNDWVVEKLISLTTEIGDGIHTTPRYANDTEFFFINGNNLDNGKIRFESVAKCVDEKEYDLLKKNLNHRTILMSINGTIGNLAFYNNEKVVLGKSAAYINIKEKIDKKYIYYLLQHSSIRTFYENELTGTTIRNLSLKSVRDTPIPLPSTLSEQTAIATVLSDTDALIENLEKLITKKRNIKQGAIQELLKPKTNWIAKKIGDVADVIGGGTPSTFISKYWNGEINWFTPTEIGDKKYTYHSNRKITKEGLHNSSARILPVGTILLTSRASIGDISILMAEGCTNQGFQSLITKHNIHNEFLYYLVLTLKPLLIQNASGSTFLEISPSKLKAIGINIPDYNMQCQIAEILSDMDTEIQILEQKLNKYRMIKHGMLQVLLTGKIRLK